MSPSPVPAHPEVRSRRRRGLLLVLVLLAAVPLAWWGVARLRHRAASPAPGLAQVVERAGQVSVTRAGAALDGAVGTPLLAGDVVATGPASTALLRFADGQVLQVAERTRVRLERGPRELRLVLEAGSVRSRTPAAPGAVAGLPLTLVLPRGGVQLTRGAEVVFTLSPEGGDVRVLTGEPLLLGADGTPRRLLAGEALAFGADGPGAAREAPLELRLVATAGAPQVRAPGEARYAPAPRTPTPLAEGSAVRVPPGAGARLTSRSLGVGVLGGSELEVGAARATPGGESYALALGAGEAALHFGGEGRRTLALGGARGGLVVEVEREASAALRQAEDGTRLAVRAGEVRVSAGGEPLTVRAGEEARLADGTLSVRALPAPALRLPARQGLRVYASGLGEVALALVADGAPAGPRAVRVEVASDAAYAQRLLAGPVTADVVQVPAPAAGELYWRALGADGVVRAQGHARFQPDRDAGRDATRPHANIAETGQQATVYFQGALPSLGLRWSAHPGAQRYRLRVYREGALEAPLLERVVDGPRARLGAGALGEGRYLWHASPLDARGVELAGGRMNRLELVYENTQRTLALSRTGRRDPTVRGVAPLGARLFLNDVPVALDAKGRFRVRPPTADALVFRLVTPDGGEAYWVRPARAAPRLASTPSP